MPPPPAADLRSAGKCAESPAGKGEAPVPKGRKLLEKDGVEVRLNAKGSLEIGVKIDLRENADYIKKIYETMTEINSRHDEQNKLKVRVA